MIEFIKKIVSYPIRRMPLLRKRFWKQFYDFTARAVADDDFVFMNLGYADLNAAIDSVRLQDPSQVNYFSEQLYQHVAGAVSLKDKEVLEIGCGRGGGSAFITRSLGPRSVTALDYSGVAIERCKQRYNIARLTFQQGDAEALPFADQSFDAVVSVESSNVYASREKFVAEVRRVLRPSGYFLFADMANPFLDNMSIGHLRQLLDRSGLKMIKAENITANVLKAREILSDSPAFEKSMARWAKSLGKSTQSMRAVFCLKGSVCYQRLETGQTEFWRWVMQKE